MIDEYEVKTIFPTICSKPGNHQILQTQSLFADEVSSHWNFPLHHLTKPLPNLFLYHCIHTFMNFREFQTSEDHNLGLTVSQNQSVLKFTLSFFGVTSAKSHNRPQLVGSQVWGWGVVVIDMTFI